MFSRSFMTVLAVLCAVSPALAGSQPGTTAPVSRVPGDRIVVAQACGWFAIAACSTNRAEANRELQRLQECCRATKTYPKVIVSSNYPNFAPGYYCVAVGPDSKFAAEANAGAYRDDFPTVYVKSSC